MLPKASHTNRTEIRHGNAEAAEPVDPLRVKSLERNAASEQAVDVHRLRDVDIVEPEMLELGEKKHGGGINLG